MERKSIRVWIANKVAPVLAKHPWWVILGVLGYLILPIDLIPEAFVGPLGFIDDFFVLLLPLILRYYVTPKKHFDTTAE